MTDEMFNALPDNVRYAAFAVVEANDRLAKMTSVYEWDVAFSIYSVMTQEITRTLGIAKEDTKPIIAAAARIAPAVIAA